jgi:hypothetical protein
MIRYPVAMLHFSSSTKVMQKPTTRCMGSAQNWATSSCLSLLSIDISRDLDPKTSVVVQDTPPLHCQNSSALPVVMPAQIMVNSNKCKRTPALGRIEAFLPDFQVINYNPHITRTCSNKKIWPVRVVVDAREVAKSGGSVICV